MRLHWFQAVARVAGVVMLVGAASCTSKSSNDTMANNPSASTQAIAVSHVELGKNVDADKRVTDQSREFKPEDTIYATVLTNGAAPNAEIKARWMTEDGQVVEETTQTIVPTGTDATEFHISKPDGWPTGKYKVEIFLNGQPAGTEMFEISA
jgi:hypothetical protein